MPKRDRTFGELPVNRGLLGSSPASLVMGAPPSQDCLPGLEALPRLRGACGPIAVEGDLWGPKALLEGGFRV